MTNSIDLPFVKLTALQWLERLTALGLEIEPGRVRAPGGATALLESGPTGEIGLSLIQPSPSTSGLAASQPPATTIRLASTLKPALEDQKLVERFTPRPGRNVICLGLGLAYHLEELVARLSPDDQIFVFESRPELAAAALVSRDLGPLLARPGLYLSVGPWETPPLAPEIIKQAQILWRPATARHLAAEYAWAPRPDGAVRPPARARRLLLFQSGYYLERELLSAAHDLGLETEVWRFERGETLDEMSFKQCLAQIKSFQPDLALTVNHLGFDAEGLMDDLFTRLNLPLASWFVDSPAFILGANKPSPYVSAFSWDSDYLETLRRQGFESVSYLPLASDPHTFSASPGQEIRQPVAFVGDSLARATAKYALKLGLRADSPVLGQFLEATDQAARAFLANSALLPQEKDLCGLAALAGVEPEPEHLANLGALVTWRASRLWRLEVVGAVQKEVELTVAGDPGWAEVLNFSRLLKPLDYYTELKNFYQTTGVNLNITSAQMKTGLNQRVFDVPAAGAFLLTDHRAQLFELFEPGSEVATYSDPQEAGQLAAWYGAHPEARDKIIRAARRRVADTHLYRHRLAEILKSMKMRPLS